MSSGGGRAMIMRQLRANRVSTLVITVLVAVASVAQMQAFTSAFPNAVTRQELLAPFVNNSGLRVLYGYPFDISDVTGWVSWRSVSFVELVVAIWAIVVTTGALRGEEEAGRAEITLAQPQPRLRWFAAALITVCIEAVVIGAGSVIAMAADGLPQHLMSFANCLELGLQITLPAIIFGAVAAVTSQLLGTVRSARVWASGVLAIAFMIRAVADTGSGVSWLRWVSPLGWLEELRPPQAPHAIPLIATIGAAVVLGYVAIAMLGRRDLGLGVLAQQDSRPPRRFLLGAPWQAALRDEIPQLAGWLAATVATAALMGGLVKTVVNFLDQNQRVGKILGTSIGPNAFIAGMFSLFQLIAALLVVTLLVGARTEESTGRLEIVLGAPQSRTGWLASRATLAVIAATILTLAAAVAMWAGAALTGQHVWFGGLMEATANSVPIMVVTVGVITAAFGFAPRSVAFGYALVAAAYLWDALGVLLKAPGWSLNISPFHALARMPLQAFAATPVIVLSVTGLAALAAGLVAFRRRDLVAG